MIIYSIKWKCKGHLQATDRQLKLVQLDEVLCKRFTAVTGPMIIEKAKSC
jgi:hypothetical protein